MFVIQLAMAMIGYYGGKLHIDGEISIGNISSFLLYMIQLIMNMFPLIFSIDNFFKVEGATAKILKIMKEVPKINTRGGMIIPEDKVEGEIELSGVNFHYPTKPDVQVLNNLSLKIKKNTVVALVGESGCGKSSIIGLIERFYEPESGTVKFSGHEIKDLDPKWYKT